jgi:hypothetical protein
MWYEIRTDINSIYYFQHGGNLKEIHRIVLDVFKLTAVCIRVVGVDRVQRFRVIGWSGAIA